MFFFLQAALKQKLLDWLSMIVPKLEEHLGDRSFYGGSKVCG